VDSKRQVAKVKIHG